MKSVIGPIALASAWVVGIVLPGCIQSSCEEKRTCGGSPAPRDSEAGSGGELALVPFTGGRAGGNGFGLGGSPPSIGGASSEGGAAGSEAEPVATGGEPAAGGAGDGGEPSMTEAEAGSASTAPTACQPNPCAHGTCSLLGASFECKCDPGYDGNLCEKNIDDCTPNPCRNGGRCDDGVGEYSCVCDGRFTGDDCELPRFEIIRPEFEVQSVTISHVSGNGLTLAGYYVSQDGEYKGAFGWKDGRFQVLPTPKGFTSAMAKVVSGDGTAFFGEASTFDENGNWASQPVTWRDGNVSLLPKPAGWTWSGVYASTADGSMAVGASDSSMGKAATIWNGSSVSTLPLDVPVALATGISSDGRVVGTMEPDREASAFQWQDGDIHLLPKRAGTDLCWAQAINTDGTRIFGGCAPRDQETAFLVLWTNGSLRDVEPPDEELLQNPRFRMDAFSPNVDAATGMAIDSITGDELPVIWTDKLGMRWMIPVLEEQGVDLSPYYWHADGRPQGVSNDGKIVVGTVYDSNYSFHSFIARLP